MSYSTSFTYSKTMEGTSQNLAATSLPENSYNYKADYSVADINRGKVLTANSSYDLPFFLHSKNLFLREGVAGWVVSGVFLLQSGAPLNLILNKDYAGIGTDGTAERVQLVPGVDPYTHQDCSGAKKFPCQYLNTAAFTTPAPGTFGNASRNFAVGPRYTSTDLSRSSSTSTSASGTTRSSAPRASTSSTGAHSQQ